MKTIFLMALGFLASCTTAKTPHRWELPNVGKVVCHGDIKLGECGLIVSNCTDSKTVTFGCLGSAKYLGPGDHFEPEIYDEPKVPADYAPDGD